MSRTYPAGHVLPRWNAEQEEEHFRKLRHTQGMSDQPTYPGQPVSGYTEELRLRYPVENDFVIIKERVVRVPFYRKTVEKSTQEVLREAEIRRVQKNLKKDPEFYDRHKQRQMEAAEKLARELKDEEDAPPILPRRKVEVLRTHAPPTVYYNRNTGQVYDPTYWGAQWKTMTENDRQYWADHDGDMDLMLDAHNERDKLPVAERVKRSKMKEGKLLAYLRRLEKQKYANSRQDGVSVGAGKRKN